MSNRIYNKIQYPVNKNTVSSKKKFLKGKNYIMPLFPLYSTPPLISTRVQIIQRNYKNKIHTLAQNKLIY